MKKTLCIITLFLMLFSLAANAQTLQNVKTALDQNFNDPQIANEKIVSDGGLNAFFGKKVAYYLSGAQDLSLYKTYFILDSEGGLSLAYNVSPKTDVPIKHLHTFGLKANIEDGFSAFFKENETQGDIGLTYRYTYFFPGTLNFDEYVQRQKGRRPAAATNPQWTKMKDRRLLILNTLRAKLSEEETEFNNSLNGVSDPTPIISDFQSEKLSEYVNEQAELEADALIENDDAYNSIHKEWISLEFYIPVTASKYTVAPDFVTETGTEYYYPAEGKLSLNAFWEAKRGKLFVNAALGAKYNSTISTELEGIDEIETTQYKHLGGVDTLRLANLNSSKVYIGEYESFVTTSITLQVAGFPNFLSWDKVSLGVSASCEINVGKFDPLNLRFGVPIRLDADEDGKPINIELRGQFFDFNGTVTDKAPKSNFTFGIGIGLPFNSLIK